jgi:hypothetical protein
MHHLKSELENAAFRVLYQRQYALATSLYAKDGAVLQVVTSFVRRAIEVTLGGDVRLAGQLERLTVTARVKQPYSLWRKLLKRQIRLCTASDMAQSFPPLNCAGLGAYILLLRPSLDHDMTLFSAHLVSRISMSYPIALCPQITSGSQIPSCVNNLFRRERSLTILSNWGVLFVISASISLRN